MLAQAPDFVLRSLHPPFARQSHRTHSQFRDLRVALSQRGLELDLAHTREVHGAAAGGAGLSMQVGAAGEIRVRYLVKRPWNHNKDRSEEMRRKSVRARAAVGPSGEQARTGIVLD